MRVYISINKTIHNIFAIIINHVHRLKILCVLPILHIIGNQWPLLLILHINLPSLVQPAPFCPKILRFISSFFFPHQTLPHQRLFNLIHSSIVLQEKWLLLDLSLSSSGLYLDLIGDIFEISACSIFILLMNFPPIN